MLCNEFPIKEGNFSFLSDKQARNMLNDSWNAYKLIDESEHCCPTIIFNSYVNNLKNTDCHSGGSMCEFFNIICKSTEKNGWKKFLFSCVKGTLSMYITVSNKDSEQAKIALNILDESYINDPNSLDLWNA